MGNHPNRGNPGLTYPEARAMLSVIGDVDVAHFEHQPKAYEAAAKSGEAKLDALPKGAVLIPFTKAELVLLWEAITNGAEGVLQPSSGNSWSQKRAFRDAANRIAQAGNLGPKF